MKLLFVVSFLLTVALCLSHPHFYDDDLNLEQEWTAFKQTYGRHFLDQNDESSRKAIFERNLLKVKMQNFEYSRGLKSFTTAINRFSDMTTDEVKNMMNRFKLPANYTRNGSKFLRPLQAFTLPDEVDWRTKGYVSEVKDQGGCGSCWAFSATGAMEGQHFRATGKMVLLSEQNLVDCSKAYGNEGCGGGLMDQAFQYVKENKGIDTEESYPYLAIAQSCNFNSQSVGATITGYTDLKQGDEQQLMEAVATVGPISVAIDAGQDSFQGYEAGIYDEPACSSTNLDHGVLVVGYGSEGGRDYWIVKNSWGAAWGEKGYLRMSRNKNNQCGIATFPSYPNV